MDMINILYIAGAIALIALAVLFVYLAMLVKRANSMIDAKVNPMLDDAKYMTTSLKPAIDQIDPLMERINLTMDAANLEIMRVDEILEDVSVITDKLADTTSTVNEVTNIPLNAVNGVASRVRGAFKSRNAGTTSAALGAKKEAE
ncbi:MAG: DUF948 domain-containing protein [Coriobacteriaceae bacterium]|nr:DUF948 domain-containing protein [Coriobacteriaceae bacterium]